MVHSMGHRLAHLVVFILALLSEGDLGPGGNSLLLLGLVLINTEDLVNGLCALCADGLGDGLTLLLGRRGLEGGGANLGLDDRVLDGTIGLWSHYNRSCCHNRSCCYNRSMCNNRTMCNNRSMCHNMIGCNNWSRSNKR